MAFSETYPKTGLFCVPCVLFAKFAQVGVVKGGHQKSGHLVTFGCSQYSYLLGSDGHVSLTMKKAFYLFAAAFHSCMRGGVAEGVSSMLDMAHAKQVKENSVVIESILDVVLLMGRLNMPFRGQRGEKLLGSHFLRQFRKLVEKGGQILEGHDRWS